MEVAIALLDELYEIHDYYFPIDPTEKRAMLNSKLEELLASLESAGNGGSGVEKSLRYFIRGRALDVFSDYSMEAEIFLLKAVKLDPYNADALDSLGYCFWKKNDLAGARHCFNDSILKKQTPKSLRHLSMLLRKIAESERNKPDLFQESLLHAKTAVSLSPTDPMSWFNLGNAYVSIFFKISHRPQDLERALQAYNSAERNDNNRVPDLYFNRAQVLQFKQDYEKAIKSYEQAISIDPQLHDRMPKLKECVENVADILHSNGRIKAKKLNQILVDLRRNSTINLSSGKELVPISSLCEGENNNKFLVVKVLMSVGSLSPPEQFLAIDFTGSMIIVSIYEVNREQCIKLAEQSNVTIIEPFLKTIRWMEENNCNSASYKCIQVKNPMNLIVDGYPLQTSYAELQLDHFDK